MKDFLLWRRTSCHICQLNSLFISPEYFQKYFYLSSFKMTTFLLLLKYFFWSVLCTLLQVVFLSVTKLLLEYNFRVLFTPLIIIHLHLGLTIHIHPWIHHCRIQLHNTNSFFDLEVCARIMALSSSFNGERNYDPVHTWPKIVGRTSSSVNFILPQLCSMVTSQRAESK